MILKDHVIIHDDDTPIKLAFMGDIHWEVVNCDIAHFERDINRIKREKYYLVLMGDQFDSLLPDDKRYAHEILREEYRKLDPAKMITKMVHDLADYFVPIQHSGYLLGIHSGNHENVLARVHKRDITYEFCCAIQRVPGDGVERHPLDIGYRCGHRLRLFKEGENGERLRSRMFTICTWHGDGAAYTPEGKMRILRRKADEFIADLHVIGHWHTLDFKEDFTRATIDKIGDLKLKTLQRFLGLSGTYHKSMQEGVDCYTDKRAYPASDIGALFISICPRTGRMWRNI